MNAVDERKFGYSHTLQDEIGIYVICSDKGIVDNVNHFMRGRGVVGITDTAGRIHYMVDARRNQYSAADKINELAVQSMSGNAINQQISDMLEEYGFDMSLIGTLILCKLIRRLHEHGQAPIGMKQLYAKVSSDTNMTYVQMERDVRYAIRKSKYPWENTKSIQVIRMIERKLTD